MDESAAPNLETEIAQIEQQLATKRAALEQSKHDKEILHEVVKEKIDEAVVSVPTDDAQSPQVPLPPPASTYTAPSDDFSALPPASQATVQQLVDEAFTKSIKKAIASAKATNNAAIIDAFHDLLVDQLYDHLIERGKLKQL